ncbi:MAG: dihydrofolate synthase/folylpolyglutamate synthase [Porticoccus sp.]|jgi:dihydrofolate synthase/folylpolyglutamate synthase
MKLHSLQQWLNWLETLHPSEIELGLGRVSVVAKKLNIQSLQCPVITVAGTNGKGSTVAALSTFIAAQGHSVGVYSSPHLLRFNERICINQQQVADDQLCEAFSVIEKIREHITLTYFEYTTLAALYCFTQAKVDYVVLEVGLGGRLDAVNIVDPDISIITNIALDHQQWLGDNREDIGREKAGIARYKTPLLYGEADIPNSILAVAEALETELLRAGDDFVFECAKDAVTWRFKGSDGSDTEITTAIPQLPLPSVALALQALALLKLDVDRQQLINVIGQLALPGRFQMINYADRQWILDVAHNPAAAISLADKLAADKHAGDTHIVLAMLADKDETGVVAQLAASITGNWMLAGLDTNRALSAAKLNSIVELFDVSCIEQTKDVAAALSKVLLSSKTGDRVVVTGSFYTVAAALEWFIDKGELSE